jgi:hypothetical protein
MERFNTGTLFKIIELNYELKEGCVWFDDQKM